LDINTILIIIGIASILTAIFLTSEWDFKDKFNDDERGDHPSGPRKDYVSRGSITNFSGLIDAIHYEGHANRKEERREDRGQRLRDNFTITALVATLVTLGVTCVAIFQQVGEMQKVYPEIQRQSDFASKQAEIARAEYIANQRAWIGPTGAEITEPPMDEKQIAIRIAYYNSGKSAAGTFEYSTSHKFSKVDWLSPDAAACFALQAIKTFCMNINEYSAFHVVWPTTETSYYSMFSPADPDDHSIGLTRFDNDLRTGDGVFVVTGCFVYTSAPETHHTAFCYYAEPGKVQPGALHTCFCGNGAD